MPKKKNITRTGALTNDTGAADRKTKKSGLKSTKMPITDYFSSTQFISFSLKKGKAKVDLGSAYTKGQNKTVYLNIENDEIDATWSVDLLVNGLKYCSSRTFTNNADVSWHHVETDKDNSTNLTLVVNSTSNHKDSKTIAKININ